MPASSIPPAGEVIDVILRIALPTGIPALAMPILLAQKWGTKGSDFGRVLGAALGLGLANFLRGTLPWVPGGWGWSWFLPAWLLACLAGALGIVLKPRPRLCVACTLVAAALAGAMLLPDSLRASGWGFPCLILTIGIPWLGTPSSASESRTSPTPRVPDVLLLLSLALLGGSIVLIHAHSARLMDLALMAACSLAAAAATAGVQGRDGSVVWGIPCLTLPGLMLAGWSGTSSEVPLASFLLVGFSAWPMVAFRTRQLQFRSRILRGFLLLMPVSVAVALAMRAETLEF